MAVALNKQVEDTSRILVEEGVLNRGNDKYGELEIRGYASEVFAGAEARTRTLSYTELTYTPSNTRLIVTFKQDGDTKVVKEVNASAHIGHTTDGIDYDRLNARLAEAVAA